MAGNDFGGAEVDVFDDTVVVKQNVYGVGWLVTVRKNLIGIRLTLRLDISMSDARLVEIGQTF